MENRNHLNSFIILIIIRNNWLFSKLFSLNVLLRICPENLYNLLFFILFIMSPWCILNIENNVSSWFLGNYPLLTGDAGCDMTNVQLAGSNTLRPIMPGTGGLSSGASSTTAGFPVSLGMRTVGLSSLNQSSVGHCSSSQWHTLNTMPNQTVRHECHGELCSPWLLHFYSHHFIHIKIQSWLSYEPHKEWHFIKFILKVRGNIHRNMRSEHR